MQAALPEQPQQDWRGKDEEEPGEEKDYPGHSGESVSQPSKLGMLYEEFRRIAPRPVPQIWSKSDKLMFFKAFRSLGPNGNLK